MKQMNMAALILDAKLQSRVEISEDTVTEYAHDIEQGAVFPPVLVYFDGIHYYLTDGYHRYHAHKRAGKVSIQCDVVNGTFRDAQFYATSVNRSHGLRRTHSDKRKAVMTHLDDFEWSQASNTEIAKHCGVSVSFVSNLRNSSGKMPDKIEVKTPSGGTIIKDKPAGRPAKEKEPELKGPEIKPEPAETPEFDPRDELIEHLTKENEELTKKLALAHMEGTDEEKSAAKEMIEDLTERLRIAEIELSGVKLSRDRFQAENSQLKRQVAAQQRQLKKA